MQLQSKREGLTAIAEAAGLIDTRASQEFERELVGLLDAGVRSVIIDLSKVDLITSAGIRVLVMLSQRLRRSGGGLALCALSEGVRSVFDVAGLLSQFRITATREDAVAELAKLHGAAPRGPAGSKLTRLLIKLIAEDGRDGGGAATSAGPSALTTHLRTILEPSDVPDAEPPAARG